MTFPGDLLQRFLANVAPWRDHVTVHRGRSEDEVPKLTGLFDGVYLDGLHLAFNVLQDVVMTWNKLKIGGLMIFDDYLWGHLQLDRSIVTKDGVDAFLGVIHGRYELLHLGRQVIIRKNNEGRRFEEAYGKACQAVSKDLHPFF